MVLEVIYVVRHGFRSNWIVDSNTGVYQSSVKTPTGIASDPALASYGVIQSQQLAEHIANLDPPVDVIYSSPFYRCLQTLQPAVEKILPRIREREAAAAGKGRNGTVSVEEFKKFADNGQLKSDDGTSSTGVRVENGLGEWYGLARFDHPSPASLEILQAHFENLHSDYAVENIPSVNGESIDMLHDRIAYTMHRVISTLDKDPAQPRALLLCTHAASMIAIGRVLTGYMPEDINEEDFRCGTCSLSKFKRRKVATKTEVAVEKWDPKDPSKVPAVGWKDGSGVNGGWDCEVNGDCSFLSGGEERTWHFSGDESFLKDPNAYNDAINAARDDDSRKIDGRGGQHDSGSEHGKSSRL